MVGFRGFVEGGSRLWSRGANGAVSALTRSRVISAVLAVSDCVRRGIWLVRARVGRVRGLAGEGECRRRCSAPQTEVCLRLVACIGSISAVELVLAPRAR